MIKWDEPLAFVHGLTTQQRKVLKNLDVEKVSDLLSILPRRYDDYSHLTTIAEIPTGEPVTIKVTIKEIKRVPTFRKRFVIIRAVVSDETGSIGVSWFNQPWMLKQLKAGDEIYISGAVTERPRFGRGFTSPLWEPVSEETVAVGNIAPVYPLTGSVTQKTLRKIMKSALGDIAPPQDPIPLEILTRASVANLGEALKFVHNPESMEQAEQGRRRFAFGELFTYQLALRSARIQANDAGAPTVKFDEPFAKKFVSSLPFELTPDQKKAIWAAVKDMEQQKPMRRLLQGDVGAGKTIVAVMLSALTFRAGSSAAIMAPTDLLAKQHAASFERFLIPHKIPVLLYTSSTRRLIEGGETSELTPTQAKERIARGRLVVVGTHALLEQGQSPSDLALAVVDEQHRFGVGQREALTVSSRQDGKVPHLLSMSATPIPRSLALTMLGDLDVSIIRTKPKGRIPIQTQVVIGDNGREKAYAKIVEETNAGRRVFVVCPLIDPSDKLGVKSVEAETRRLSTKSLKGLRIGMVHGRMSAKEKDEAMNRFVTGALQVLVATTVVEVGVDVPEATVMMIEGAERFGLAQLHQLRGRVGRSKFPSFCFIAATDVGPALERLKVLEQTNDGFKVAEEDLRLRGQGNLLGVQQSGATLFRAARTDDLELMASAREQAAELLEKDPDLSAHKPLQRIVSDLRDTSHQE
ncbi:ATP-dependent DNA helicase RecG [Patescibacteria group bacterium]|nr:ATP-dependent DNA helicase RecG [Patescibacteria group bacterium]